MNFIRMMIALAVLIALSSCSLLSPVKSQQSNAYLINSTPNSGTARHRNVTIFVTQPDTRAIYNTTDMAYTMHPYQVNFFGENHWAETPSQMFFPLIVETLQGSHAFKAIVIAPYTGKYNYVLSTQIIKIQQNFMVNPARFELSIRAQLMNVNDGRVVAIKQFDITQPMQARSPLGGVYAANQSAARFLNELRQFCIANT